MEGRFTLWPSGDSHRPSRISAGAATSCGPAVRSPVTHERFGPWWERPPSPRARYGFGPRWKFTPRPCPPGVAPAATIPGGKAVRTPPWNAATQPAPPAAAAVAQTARAALLPASARVVAGSRPPPRRPWPRHRDPRLPLRNGPRPGFTSRPRRPPVRGGGPGCRESGCPRRARPPAFLQRTAGPVATRRGGLGWSAHPNLRRCHNGHRKRWVATGTPPFPARRSRPGGRGATASRTTTCVAGNLHVRTAIPRTCGSSSHVRLHPGTTGSISGLGSTSRRFQAPP